MSRERYTYAIAEAAERPLVQRGLLGILLVAGLSLLMLEHAQHPAAQRLRNGLMDKVNPLLSAISQPVAAVRSAAQAVGHHFDVVEENRRLRLENERLWHWQSVAQSVKAENDALRALTDYKALENISFVTARVIGLAPGSYSQTLMINAGAAEGIRALQPVVDSYGLVGRVTDVAEHTSRVLLLSDSSSRIPVISSDSRQRAILAGTGDDDMLRLKFITADQQKIGLSETVLTTAEGNLIPGGIAIGQVFRADTTGYRVKPVRPLAQAEYVRVITQ